jgi:cell division initiation protein
MDVSPKTLREVEFREKLKGYHQDDVDDFLERVAAGIEILQERLRQATERAVRAEQKAGETTEVDDTMRRTLVLAQRTADMAVEEARQQAQTMVAQAQAHGQQLVAAAQEQAQRTAQEAQSDLWAEISRLEVARDQLRSDIASLDQYLSAERYRLHQALLEMVRSLDTDMPELAEKPPQHEIDLSGIHRWDDGPGESTASVNGAAVAVGGSVGGSAGGSAGSPEPPSAQ